MLESIFKFLWKETKKTLSATALYLHDAQSRYKAHKVKQEQLKKARLIRFVRVEMPGYYEMYKYQFRHWTSRDIERFIGYAAR